MIGDNHITCLRHWRVVISDIDSNTERPRWIRLFETVLEDLGNTQKLKRVKVRVRYLWDKLSSSQIPYLSYIEYASIESLLDFMKEWEEDNTLRTTTSTTPRTRR